MAKFTDRVILITGAASGIGRATTLKLAAQGASVAICDVNTSMLADTESMLPKGTPFLSQKVDVSSEKDVISFIEAVVEKFGRLDHVFNCAGLNPTNIPFQDTSLAYFDMQMGVNVKGVFLVTRESLKHLKRGASIVTVSNTTKHAVIGMMKSIALEYGPKGIRANCVAPGYIATPSNSGIVQGGEIVERWAKACALERWGTPEDVADVVVFLFSDEARYVSGAVYEVDGAVKWINLPYPRLVTAYITLNSPRSILLYRDKTPPAGPFYVEINVIQDDRICNKSSSKGARPDPTAGTRILELSDFNRHLDYFQAQGYNEADTARMYVNGQQEAWTAKAGWKTRGLTLATKVWPSSFGVYPEVAGMHAPRELRKHFETSLRELGTDSVDIFYLHAPDRTVPFAETMREVNEFYKEGKFRMLGLSNYPAWEVAEIYNIAKERGWVLPGIYQAMYNCFTRDIESELIPCLRKYNMELVTYNPLCGGLFSGKIKSSDLETPPTEGRFSDSYQWGHLYRDRYLNDANMKALKIVEDSTKVYGLTMLETALRWTIHHSALKTRVHGGNDGVVMGVSNFQQLESNLGDFEKGRLPEDVVEALERAWMVTKATAPSYWR
ncbi:hypothetical protein OPT61_g312 [Boeremia exigua]|uniref:Uncharacterized protein n=1 Tax=Boeremia exigua TaxID=749465 RepID=A0ACC2IUA6_9PLEO|nr:hypothetical protein OPT61_g312 [Boeremia exigua]